MPATTEYPDYLVSEAENRERQIDAAKGANDLCHVIDQCYGDVAFSERKIRICNNTMRKAMDRLAQAMDEAGVRVVVYSGNAYRRCASGVEILRGKSAFEVDATRDEPEPDADGEAPSFTVEADAGAPIVDGMRILAEIEAL